jgi:hypothetical protein
MSREIYTVAQKALDPDQIELIQLYNLLFNRQIPIPTKVINEVERIIGYIPEANEPIMLNDSNLYEYHLIGEGNPDDEEGLVIPITALPVGTIALRVYSE